MSKQYKVTITLETWEGPIKHLYIFNVEEEAESAAQAALIVKQKFDIKLESTEDGKQERERGV